MEEILDLRGQIDELDNEILRILSERAELSIRVGHVKRRTGLAARSSDRERAILRRIVKANEGPLDNAAIRRIFRLIVQESRRTAIRELRK
jgi:chorismate mutase-like protein